MENTMRMLVHRIKSAGIAALSAGMLFTGCRSNQPAVPLNPSLTPAAYTKKSGDLELNRTVYHEKLMGFWLGTCIANWTGLVTEMDKIGNLGDIKTGAFYTRSDWGQPDQPSIWGQGIPSNLSKTIDFVFAAPDSIWGADDDTDIEYMYQELLLRNNTAVLSGEQIREGWLRHIRAEEENYLWVSNQRAFDLMREGVVPPATGHPSNNAEYEMIDAQLTTELFGLFAPGRPDMAMEMAKLPIETTARDNSAWISQFYVTLFSLAAHPETGTPSKETILKMAEQARRVLPDTSYAAHMYTFVKASYENGLKWEQTRDSLYQKYQVRQEGGYTITSQNRYCNGCFAAGINFGASLISLFYGEGDLKETIKIGTLAGWDSDNPTATWGGLLGFMLGHKGVEAAFGRTFSNRFNIHRTRQGFDNNGIDTFERMAEKGVWIIDRVVQEQLKGGIDTKRDVWRFPAR
jgi:hypothetical protein